MHTEAVNDACKVSYIECCRYEYKLGPFKGLVFVAHMLKSYRQCWPCLALVEVGLIAELSIWFSDQNELGCNNFCSAPMLKFHHLAFQSILKISKISNMPIL